MTTIPSITVIVPTRSRPASMIRLVEAFVRTCRDSTGLHFVVDEDDPLLETYAEAAKTVTYPFFSLWKVAKPPRPRPGIVYPLNYVAKAVFEAKLGCYPTILGFMGDDHLPRTEGWDLRVQEAFDELKTGVVYGDDKLQGVLLPTAAFLSADIVRTLGWMAPPDLNHLYVDNFWKDLGEDLGRLRYLPDVVIEHMHPLAGKAENDQTYDDCNNPNAGRDKVFYKQYRKNQYVVDLERLRKLL